jgi:hypothetical protein
LIAALDDGAALARVLHVTGSTSPSHHCWPIVVVQLPLSNCCPQNATIVFIDIVTVSGGSIILITVAVTVAVAVTVYVSAVAVIAVIVDVHCICPIVVVKLLSSYCRP